MAEGKMCVCPQCGKKFKLKAGFSAASFACTGCSAAVWVDGKPPAPASKRSGGRTKGRAGRRGRGARAAPKVEVRPGQPHNMRHRKKDNTGVLLAIGGGFLLIAVGLYYAFGGFETPAPEQTTIADRSDTAGGGDTAMKTDGDTAGGADTAAGADGCGSKTDGCGDGCGDAAGGGDAAAPGGDNVPDADKPKTPPKKLSGGKTKKLPKGVSRWDPPATLGHLNDTPAEMRAMIDEQIKLMMDMQAGRDSLIAKQKLAAIGKPAFLPIISAMAKVRDSITDVDSMDERLIESSLLLADQCLREMDGFLESKQKAPIRPGTDKKYITYILRLHYKRWVQVLEAMPEMPGPYDLASEYKDEEDGNYDKDD